MEEYICSVSSCLRPAVCFCECVPECVLVCIEHQDEHLNSAGQHHLVAIYQQLAPNEQNLVRQGQEYVVYCTKAALQQVLSIEGCNFSEEAAVIVCSAILEMQETDSFLSRLLSSSEYSFQVSLAQQLQSEGTTQSHEIYQEGRALYNKFDTLLVKGQNVMSSAEELPVQKAELSQRLKQLFKPSAEFDAVTSWLSGRVVNYFLREKISQMSGLHGERIQALKLFSQAVAETEKGNIPIEKFQASAAIQKKFGFAQDLLDTLWNLGAALERAGNYSQALVAYSERLLLQRLSAKVLNVDLLTSLGRHPLVLCQFAKLYDVAEEFCDVEAQLSSFEIIEKLVKILSKELQHFDSRYVLSIISLTVWESGSAPESLIRQLAPTELENLQRSSILAAAPSEPGHYVFSHPALLNFFLATALIAEIDKSQPGAFDSTAALNSLDFCNDYSVRASLIEQMGVDRSGYETKLLDIVFQTRRRHDITRASANAISILNQMNYCFTGKNFSRVKINKANLSGADLTDTNLSYCEIKQVNFSQASLVRTRVKGNQLINPEFGVKRSDASHKDLVTAACFSQDCTLLASGSLDYSVKIWNIQFNTPMQTLLKHKAWISALCFSPDDSFLASADMFGMIVVWRVGAGILWRVIPCELMLNTLFSSIPFIALRYNKTILTVWDLSTGLLMKSNSVESLRLSRGCTSCDGTIMAFGSFDGTVVIWDIAAGQELWKFKPHVELITALSFTADSAFLASGSADATLVISEVSTGRTMYSLKADREVSNLCLSPNGALVAYGTQSSKVYISQVATGTVLRVIENVAFCARLAMSFSADSAFFAIAVDRKCVGVWNMATLELHYIFETTVDRFSFVTGGGSLIASRSGKNVLLCDAMNRGSALLPQNLQQPCCVYDGFQAVVNENKLFQVYDLQSGQKQFEFKGDDATVMSMSTDCKLLASSSHDRNTVSVWNLATGQRLHSFRTRSAMALPLAFSADNKYLAAGDKAGRITLWSLHTGNKLFTAVAEVLTAVCFSADGVLFGLLESRKRDAEYCGSPPHSSILVFDILTGHLVCSFQTLGVYSSEILFSHDSSLIFCLIEDGVSIWSILECKKLCTALLPTRMDNTKLYSSKHEVQVAGVKRQCLLMWNLAQCLKDQSTKVRSICFSPDRTLIGSATSNRVVSMWDAFSGQLVWRHQLTSGSGTTLCFLPSSELIVCSRIADSLSVRQVVPEKELCRIRICPESKRWTLSPQGLLAFISPEKTLTLWNIAEMQLVRTFEFTELLGLSPEGDVIATEKPKGTASFWQVSTGQIVGEVKIYSLTTVRSLCLSPYGEHVGLGTGNEVGVELYKNIGRPTFERVSIIDDHTRRPRHLCFSLDGTLLAFSISMKTGTVREVATRNEVYRFSSRDVTSLCFSPDGAQLVSGHLNGHITIHQIPGR